jgi:hypothetical protein
MSDALETKEASASCLGAGLMLSLAPAGDCGNIRNDGKAI